jgi:hypothetical protein
MKTLHALTLLALAACSTDDSSPPITDRGGPDALAGIEWHTTFSQNGIDFDFSFAFDDAKVSATNRCSFAGQSLTASTASAVKYRYDVNVPTAGHGGDSSCFIDVAAGKFSFEIAGDNLIMMANGETVTFTPAGPVSGLYGEWTATQDGFTVTWSMGNGKIHATATCPSGSASTEVSAQFTNLVDILEDQSQTVGDDSFNCTVSIAKAMAEYHFEGDDLVMTVNGQSLTFHR